MQLTPWGPAVTGQLNALQLIELAVKGRRHHDVKGAMRHHRWEVEAELLKQAVPFAWGNMPSLATLAASSSIPDDTVINDWNLPSEVCWWHLEKPVPICGSEREIRALLFGWVTEQIGDDEDFVVIGKHQRPWPADWAKPKHRHRYLACATYMDDPIRQFPITPGLTWRWEEGTTLEEACANGFREHQRNYGPGASIVEEDPSSARTFEQSIAFINSVKAVAQFLIAGTIWLNQKVVVTANTPVTPKRNAEFKAATSRDLHRVRVISLRKAEPREPTGTSDAKWHVSVQFVVSGHWRNQACGPKRGDRRLTYIQPFTKGPDGAPFKEAAKKVYTVDR